MLDQMTHIFSLTLDTRWSPLRVVSYQCELSLLLVRVESQGDSSLWQQNEPFMGVQLAMGWPCHQTL